MIHDGGRASFLSVVFCTHVILWHVISYACCIVFYSGVEAVWIGLRQRQSSGPLEWANENTIPYNMHYYGKLLTDDSRTGIFTPSALGLCLKLM